MVLNFILHNVVGHMTVKPKLTVPSSKHFHLTISGSLRKKNPGEVHVEKTEEAATCCLRDDYL
jgi:hypothetical protein